ncbi:MAG: hypothetical protein LRY68_10405 [Sulfurospirillum sp.]|nr:hypothetical protein [Sulfurospirillum sp.]
MDIAIEKALASFKSHIIDHATLADILLTLGYSRINDKIADLKRRGMIVSLKSGLYVHTSPLSSNIVSKEIIANNLLGPSYISFDYALSFYGLIPERVHEVTSATTKRSKAFQTDFGVFSYRQINKEIYPIGLQIHSLKNGNFLMASKEKALCDKVYFTKDISIRTKSAMMEFLINDFTNRFR